MYKYINKQYKLRMYNETQKEIQNMTLNLNHRIALLYVKVNFRERSNG